MTITVTRSIVAGTASMLGDPEAHRSGGASVSCPDRGVPCTVGGEWVPDVEAPVVPVAQRELCLRCPVRQWCLSTALESFSVGYWAGTTTAQRRSLQRYGAVGSVAAVDAMQDEERARHLPGQGSLRSYRRDRCRCHECRRHNADAKLTERARARQAEAVAAA